MSINKPLDDNRVPIHRLLAYLELIREYAQAGDINSVKRLQYTFYSQLAEFNSYYRQLAEFNSENPINN